MKRLLVIIGLLYCLRLPAAEVIPPQPALYFNDYANVVSPATAARLNRALEDNERQTSSQIIVAVFPKMQSDSSIDDYTFRIARAWRVGQKVRNNGAILFVFVQDRKLFIQVGYGLEGALPDALCKRIIDDEIVPRLKQGDFEGGLVTGVAAMIAATRGEYTGTGRTARETGHGSGGFWGLVILAIILMFIFGGWRRRRPGLWSGWMIGGGGYGWGGGGWGGGGWGGGGGGGGGFTGGGGSFGGGGAGGSW